MPESYFGKALDFLNKFNTDIGDLVELKKNGVTIRGVLMPTYSKDDDIIVIKLDNGYNIGISINSISEFRVLSKGERREEESKKEEKNEENGQTEVMIISTGGTIVSKIEYETGAVRPALTTEEIIEFMPEINEIAKISAQVLFSILSENMKPEYWIKIAEEAKKH
jgi:glutamyl-tRNA(Gln) amidotransferase subunit D